MTRRDPYLHAAAAGRLAIERATAAKVPLLEMRVLAAVLHYTALRSRLGDHVYLAQLAAVTYATDDVQPWQLVKIRQAFTRLRAARAITTKAPRGRHAAVQPRYWIELPNDPELDTSTTRTNDHDPDTSTHRPTTNNGVRGGPVQRPGIASPTTRDRSLQRPVIGSPTEVNPRGFTEEGGTPPDGVAATLAGTGTEGAARPAGEVIFDLAHTDDEQDHAWDVLTALEKTPGWFKQTLADALNEENPGTLHAAIDVINQHALSKEVDLALPRGPK